MIYQPMEDSYLLNDYVKSLEIKGKDFLEIGVGSGLIAESAVDKGANVTAADLNQEALNQLDNGIEKVKSDLFNSIDGKYDLIVFNPPYLPGEDEESSMPGSETWYGGKKGIEVSQRFLRKCGDHLKEGGDALVVASSLSDFESLIEEFSLEIVDEKRLFFEQLFLLRYSVE